MTAPQTTGQSQAGAQTGMTSVNHDALWTPLSAAFQEVLPHATDSPTGNLAAQAGDFLSSPDFRSGCAYMRLAEGFKQTCPRARELTTEELAGELCLHALPFCKKQPTREITPGWVFKVLFNASKRLLGERNPIGAPLVGEVACQDATSEEQEEFPEGDLAGQRPDELDSLSAWGQLAEDYRRRLWQQLNRRKPHRDRLREMARGLSRRQEEQRERENALLRLLSGTNARDWLALYLNLVVGMTFERIAALFNEKLDTVKRRCNRRIQRIRKPISPGDPGAKVP